MERYDPEHKGDKLLEELDTKRFTPLEFQRECAKWLLEPEVWNTFHPKPFPAKTAKIIEHESTLLSARKDLSKKYYEDNPEILKYYDKKLSSFAANEQRIKDLTEFMDSIDNAEQYEKLKTKKAEFVKVVAQQGVELRIERYIYGDSEYQNVAKEFEGDLVNI